ncbi:hypothetical protein BRD06_02925 [Halobacteriales archaeon QS_9_67_15]|nr:MAG: hypothetical protein BRD06_02925 [Halobacteriales archaeon QS_9_67_15]
MEQSWPLPPAVTLAALVVILVLAGAGSLVLSSTSAGTVEAGTTPQKLVEPRPGNNVFWPYTSRGRTPAGRTLAINVVVYEDAETVRFYLSQRRGATWNETEEQWQDVDPDDGDQSEVDAGNRTVVDWAAARGAKRFLYVHDAALTREGANETRRPYRALPYTGGTEAVGGRWIDETYQLHDGKYFGSRYHLRLYESPFEDDEWVAIQAHSDHWDWFRLRHTVHDTEDAQDYVESEFRGDPAVDTVWRMYLDNRAALGSDGWATVVDFRGGPTPLPDARTAGLALVAGLVAVNPRPRRWPLGRVVDSDRGVAATPPGDDTSQGWSLLSKLGLTGALQSWERLSYREFVVLIRGLSYLLLFVSLFGVYLSVRFGGLFLEGQFQDASPKAIAAALYPVLAFGLPLAAYGFSRGLRPVRCFAVAALGVGAAIVVDYQSLGVTVLPLDVVLHRLGIATALGLVAGGSVHRHDPLETVNRLLAAGVLLWVFLLIAPLVGWL